MTQKKNRIISLVPSQTELLVDLGLENSLVGITKFCIYPAYLQKTKTIVGGTKNINIDKIKLLKPTIILCNKEENTKEIAVTCNKIAKTHVSNIYTLQDSLDLIKEYGILFSCEKKATKISKKIEAEKSKFNEFIINNITLRVAYFIWKNPFMVAANNTFINHILELNHFKNVFSYKERYPIIDIEKLSAKNIDLIFLSSEPYPFQEKHIIELKEKLPNTKILLVNGEFFSWYGSRLLNAFSYFTTLRKRINNFYI